MTTGTDSQPTSQRSSTSRARRLVPALILALPIAWLAGLIWFAATIPEEVADPDAATDAIIVLTGGSQRLATGLELLAAGKAHQLFISGVHHGVPLADLLRTVHPAPHDLPCCIVLGHDADSTFGNAAETATWMRKEGYASLRLVTASYHMRRSIFEFSRAMPDVRLIAHPVFPERVHLARWWASPGTAALITGEYDKYLGALVRSALALPGGAPETPEESGDATTRTNQ
jgi:uncharacterized SAM-binding protein YcdF (DUF218 family)